MQELEKILEEIDEEIEKERAICEDIEDTPGWGLYEKTMKRAKDIIRNHMNDNNEIVEQCPYCENEVALHWDVEKDGYQIFCPYCGKPMMLCSMCDARDGAVCDWEKEKGCKHSNERYCTNDGWISVDDKLPEDDVDVLVTYADIDDEEYADITITTYGNAYLGGNKLDFKEWRSPFEYFKSNYKVMAWQYLPEPYRPERNNEE